MRIYSRTRAAGLVVLAATFLLASSVTADDDLRARAEEAFEAARAHTLREPLGGRLDAVWHTDLLLQIRPDPQLQWWADLRRRQLKAHKTYRLVDPNGPLYPLPDDPGTGMAKWYTYMAAPFGTPPSTAIRYIRAYLQVDNPLAAPETGYILTHQLLVLEWAQQVGLELPEDVLAKKPALLARIAEEHADDDTFSDLFAERICFLILYGTPPEEEIERSTRVIVDAQTAPGVWSPPAITLRYDGEDHHTEVEPEHARKMAMITLAAYLGDRGDGSRSDGLDPDAGAQAEAAGHSSEDGETDSDTVAEASSNDDGASSAVWGWLAGAGLLVVLFFLVRRFRR